MPLRLSIRDVDTHDLVDTSALMAGLPSGPTSPDERPGCI